MTDEKKLKRDIRTIWDGLKHERRARSKMTGATELAESAQRIASYGTDLKDVAKRMAAFEGVQAGPASVAKRKAKAKPKTKPHPN